MKYEELRSLGLVIKLVRGQPAGSADLHTNTVSPKTTKGHDKKPSGAENKVNLVAVGIGCMHQSTSHKVGESGARSRIVLMRARGSRVGQVTFQWDFS